MKLLGRTHKVGCAARGCQRIATYHFFMPARKDAQGRNHAAYETYSCAYHTAHYQRYTTNYNQCDRGYTVQSAGVNELCQL